MLFELDLDFTCFALYKINIQSQNWRNSKIFHIIVMRRKCQAPSFLPVTLPSGYKVILAKVGHESTCSVFFSVKVRSAVEVLWLALRRLTTRIASHLVQNILKVGDGSSSTMDQASRPRHSSSPTGEWVVVKVKFPIFTTVVFVEVQGVGKLAMGCGSFRCTFKFCIFR